MSLTDKQKQKSRNLPKRIEVNWRYVENEVKMAELFNEFYVQVGPSLAKKIKKKTKRCYTSYLDEAQSELVYFDLFFFLAKASERNVF